MTDVDLPLARSTDPATSHLAAQSVKPNRMRDRELVLHALRDFGPMTDENLVSFVSTLADVHPISPSGARTRRHELTVAGLVEDTGVRVKTRSGRQAILWRAAS